MKLMLELEDEIALAVISIMLTGIFTEDVYSFICCYCMFLVTYITWVIKIETWLLHILAFLFCIMNISNARIVLTNQ